MKGIRRQIRIHKLVNRMPFVILSTFLVCGILFCIWYLFCIFIIVFHFTLILVIKDGRETSLHCIDLECLTHK